MNGCVRCCRVRRDFCEYEFTKSETKKDFLLLVFLLAIAVLTYLGFFIRASTLSGSQNHVLELFVWCLVGFLLSFLAFVLLLSGEGWKRIVCLLTALILLLIFGGDGIAAG
jgi:heme/copper-type cytochrome/quinol oxidase subunit 4